VVDLAEYVQRLRSGYRAAYTPMVFSGNLKWACQKVLRNVTIPFMAANDLLALGGMLEMAYGDEGEPPDLSVQPKGTRTGLSTAKRHAHVVRFLHEGRQRYTLFPLDYDEQRKFMAAEPLLLSKKDVMLEDRRILKKGLPLHRVRPGKPPLIPLYAPLDEQHEGTLFARAHARRVEVEVEKGDLFFVPAGIPHYVENLEDTVETSIRVLDGTNVMHPALVQDMQDDGQRPPSWFPHAIKLAEKPPTYNKDLSYADWRAGTW